MCASSEVRDTSSKVRSQWWVWHVVGLDLEGEGEWQDVTASAGHCTIVHTVPTAHGSLGPREWEVLDHAHV